MRSKTWMLVACLMVAPLACGDGLSNAEAVEHCEGERDFSNTNDPDCQNMGGDPAFQECVACHEECGDHCATVDTACPYAFRCPE
jgi:hypothetical protein